MGRTPPQAISIARPTSPNLQLQDDTLKSNLRFPERPDEGHTQCSGKSRLKADAEQAGLREDTEKVPDDARRRLFVT